MSSSDPVPPTSDEQQQKSESVEGNDDATENDGDMNPDNDNKANSSTAGRRFFPRVKHLMTPEWEFFLHGVLHSIQTHNAHNCLRASTSTDNPWYLTFHAVYDGVASRSCSTPHGKNRYHKFKDKMIELWRTMASAPPPDGSPDNELWKMGHDQWETFRGLVVASGGALSAVDSIMDPSLVAANAAARTVAGDATSPATTSTNKKLAAKRASRPSQAAAKHHSLRVTIAPGDDLPHPLNELHQIWKMSVDHGDNIELGMIRKDYHRNIRGYIAGIVEHNSGELHTVLLQYLKGLNSLRSVKQDDDIRNLISGTYKSTLQGYLASGTSSGVDNVNSVAI